MLCFCGSGKPSGACCLKDEECSCGSGIPAGRCCYVGIDDEDDDGIDDEDDGFGEDDDEF